MEYTYTREGMEEWSTLTQEKGWRIDFFFVTVAQKSANGL
jgi:hypothetical protein